jgi:hypothetical protein
MSIEQRKSFRIQIPEGRDQAVFIVGRQEIQARILDESAGGYAVALKEDINVQQNQVHLLKTTTGLYQMRVARVEHFEDGKLLGLVRLCELSEDEVASLQVASWRDYLFAPQQTNAAGSGGIALGIGMLVLIGGLVCGLVLLGIRYLPSRRSPESSQYAHDFAEAVTSEVERAREAAAEAQRQAQEKSDAVKAAAHSPQFVRQQARVSAEVLYRLQLTSEQSQRVREILRRRSNDLASAEAEIRSILTAEQVQKWRTLAP